MVRNEKQNNAPELPTKGGRKQQNWLESITELTIKISWT